ncbi:MAG: DUF86 domain-containing protein [Candidatus Cloacimonetes bacterium]|nr:DUF86 domain-containing protein [Candidatus Cloacimonadota bacterium]
MLDRLKVLERNVDILNDFRNKYSLEDLEEREIEWALRYGLFESIQIVIDLSCHIVSKYNLGNPSNYADCINILYKEKYITSELAQTLKSMVGLRNILVHEYISVDVEKIYSLLDFISDFKLFVESIKNYLNDE